MNKETEIKLIEVAIAARNNAYAPYSGFCVGAALLTAKGNIYSGCNIENVAYSPSLCAERAAIAAAISNGERDFSLLAIVGGSSDDYCYPCGVCRQWLSEFCNKDFPIIIANSTDDYCRMQLSELLPYAFAPQSMQKNDK